MAWESQVFDIPGLVTDVDMSGTTGTTEGYQSTAQFLFAKLTAAHIVEPCAALTDFPIGVIQNNPKVTSSQTATAQNLPGVEVRQLGVSKIVAAASQSIGNFVGPDANGRAAVRTIASGGGDATHWVAAVLIDDAPTAAGVLGTYLLLSPFYLQA